MAGDLRDLRDIGLAYAVGLILITCWWWHSSRAYRSPPVVMAPIPLTIIGVMPGHAMFGAQYTATSMMALIRWPASSCAIQDPVGAISSTQA